MFYILEFDMERIDKAIKNGANTIYAEKSNLKNIEYPNIKKGWFEYIIINGKKIDDWPNVEFYYSSKASNLESEYLLNAASLPIIHKKVQQKFEQEGIEGIQYLPIKLIDVVTNEINLNYVVMNVLNMIEAYDMQKSEYNYDEKTNSYWFLPHTTYLDKEVCSNYDIFRCNKDTIPIYVSEKIKEIIKTEKWIGFEFYARKIN